MCKRQVLTISGDKQTLISIQSIKPKTNLISNTISPPPPAIPHSQSRSQLHSILKKPRTAQSEPQKTTRLLLERPDGQSITRIPSNPPTPNMSELSSKESQSSRPTNKKTCFSASRNTKRRQVFNHRKSSQTSVPKVSSASQQSSAPGKIFDSFDPLYDDDSLLKSAHNMQTDIISENEPGTSWLDVDSMRMSLPLSKQHNTALVSSQNTGLAISDTSHTAQQPNITPAVLAMSDKQDPILPQGIETVSAEPSRTHENEKQTSEPWTLSSSESIIKQYNPPKIEPEDIPHFPNAKSIPMPETMCTQLVSIINNPEPLDEWIPLPERPWFLAEHAWLPLVQPQYLFDWMIRDHTCIPKPQPSKKELVDKEFRSKFQIGLERARIVARREANVDVPVAIPEEDEEEVEG